MQLVLSVFPGGGKSTICKEADKLGLYHIDVKKGGEVGEQAPEGSVPLFDSDSSLFPKEEFPGNYIAHIKTILDTYPNVVVMVSSHDNVRAALAEAGIPFTLVYPARELKGEYMDRYEGRGSPEKFIEFMGENWNNFIDSAESDPNQTHIVLGEGKFLLDAVKEKIQEVVLTADAGKGIVTGFESMGDIIRTSDGQTFDSSSQESLQKYFEHKAGLQEPTPVVVTTTILDVNGNTDEASGIIAEPSTLEPSVSNEPENSVNVNEVPGGQPAVDASTVDDSAMEEPTETRAELLEAMSDVGEDVKVLEVVLEKANSPELAGSESFAPGSELLVTAVTDIKDRYGVDVEPSISGLEGFFTTLKKMFDGLGKKTEKKSEAAFEYIYNADKIVDGYASASFLDGKKFKEGEVTVTAPAGLGKNPDLKQILSTIDKLSAMVEKDAKKYGESSLKNTQAALRVYNKYAKHAPIEESETEALLAKDFPIKPEALEHPGFDLYKNKFDIKPVAVTVPALNEESVKEAVEVLLKFSEWVKKIFKYYVEVDKISLDHAEMAESKFWDSIWDTDEVEQLNESLYFQSSTRNVSDVIDQYDDIIMPIAKFLESWILNSFK